MIFDLICDEKTHTLACPGKSAHGTRLSIIHFSIHLLLITRYKYSHTHEKGGAAVPVPPMCRLASAGLRLVLVR